jgi:hypothetical protein
MASNNPYRSSGADFSDAVRAIRVAVALNEQYGVIVRPKNYSDPDELSRVIGEARQLFPAIWSNLDHARDALLRHGREVGRYDEIRSQAAVAAGGVLDVMAKDADDLVHLTGGVAKSARLNREGHTAATEACDVLRGALPQVDWAALDRAEAEEIAAAGSLRPGRWKAVVIVAIGFVALVIAAGAYAYMRTVGKG